MSLFVQSMCQMTIVIIKLRDARRTSIQTVSKIRSNQYIFSLINEGYDDISSGRYHFFLSRDSSVIYYQEKNRLYINVPYSSGNETESTERI